LTRIFSPNLRVPIKNKTIATADKNNFRNIAKKLRPIISSTKKKVNGQMIVNE
jgi:hypothetical protein